jgi:hypothetical protein
MADETSVEEVKQDPKIKSNAKAREKRAPKKARSKKKGVKRSSSQTATSHQRARGQFPKHAVEAALRIPRAILDQNAGKECSETEAAGFLGVRLSGPISVEISSARKYGFLERPSPGRVSITDLSKRVLRPQRPNERLEGLRQAVLNAPVISDVYKHYRGENLPDQQFFDNALVDTFRVPATSLSEFKDIFVASLKSAELLEEHGGKLRVIDIAQQGGPVTDTSDTLRKLGRTVSISDNDTCFVVMPFALPLGDHYRLIYEPAITKAGLKAVRADDDIFATGKIIDQVWSGISAAKVLVAELTSRNPNVFYELGLAHALQKPVVLVSANELDVPFDVRHIRVIYYDVHDPFWGEKLINKVAENILSALRNPEEAIFQASRPGT